jgi:hypothetical protein
VSLPSWPKADSLSRALRREEGIEDALLYVRRHSAAGISDSQLNMTPGPQALDARVLLRLIGREAGQLIEERGKQQPAIPVRGIVRGVLESGAVRQNGPQGASCSAMLARAGGNEVMKKSSRRFCASATISPPRGPFGKVLL